MPVLRILATTDVANLFSTEPSIATVNRGYSELPVTRLSILVQPRGMSVGTENAFIRLSGTLANLNVSVTMAGIQKRIV